jgi:MFS family permease
MRRSLTIPPDLVQRVWMRVDGSRHGTRNAVLAGASIGLAFSLMLRLWMRLITDQEPVFTAGGTIFIVLVVTGFGAAAGYAFAVRHRTRRRFRKPVDRAMGFVPMLGMGPFMVFFLGGAVLAWLPSHPNARRSLRWGLIALGVIVTAFWTLLFLSGGEDLEPSLIRAVIYLAVGYVLFVSLRFALTPTAAARDEGQPSVFGGGI